MTTPGSIGPKAIQIPGSTTEYPIAPELINGRPVAKIDLGKISLNADSYHDELVARSSPLLAEAAATFNLCMHDWLETCCIALTGSDGRSENSRSLEQPGSSLEIVHICSSSQQSEESKERLHALVQAINESSAHDWIIPIIESRSLDEERSALCFYEFGQEDQFPTRVFDLKFLSGSERVFREYQAKALTDLQSTKTLGNFNSKQVKRARKNSDLAERGKDPSIQITESEASASLDPINKKFGLKRCVLRPFQYTVAMQLFTAFKEGLLTQPFSELPPTLCGRLKLFREQKILLVKPPKEAERSMTDEELDGFVNAYTTALAVHNLSTDVMLRYAVDETRVSLDPDQLKLILKQAKTFSQHGYLRIGKPKVYASKANRSKKTQVARAPSSLDASVAPDQLPPSLAASKPS